MNHGNYVVLNTEKGQEFGWVVRQPRSLVLAQPEVDPSTTVVRKGTAPDFGRWQQLKETESDALQLARAKARELQLSMKIVATHYTFDRSRIIVAFGAEGGSISGHYCASWEPPCDAG